MSDRSLGDKLIESVPVPMCVIDEKGKVTHANHLIGSVFLYDEIIGIDFFQLTGIKYAELAVASDAGKFLTTKKNGKIFRVLANREYDMKEGHFFVFFNDITELESVRTAYNDEKVCVAVVRIDNYDEMIASTPPDMRMQLSSQIDKTIRKWAANLNASLINNKEDEYNIYFHHYYLDKITSGKFAILDEVRQIETEADFPVSLSIGVGVGGDNIRETEEEGDAALELALGRGGDQAVVKQKNQTDYYGGRMQTVEKSNKGKSRVITHLLKQLIDETEQIFIMGHSNPDTDAFGSALGMFRVCKTCGRDPYIVLNEVSESLQVVYQQAAENPEYTFINSERAIQLADENSLLIIVDTHRPSYLECRELLELVGKIAIIDHHRKAADAIPNADLHYIEAYASSASELVAEILQYTGPKRVLRKLEAEALLGGIFIDTNRFAVKTGVRTFEAAAWLRRCGADTTEVKRFFQTDMDIFRVRAKGIASAVFHSNGVATSICEGENQEAQIINSQIADELLNIKGVKAAFVAGRNAEGKTVVSARSLGAINVQVIMEKMGGGGHLTTAGAQLPDKSPEEVLDMVKELVNERK